MDRKLVAASNCNGLTPIVKVENSKTDEPKCVLTFEGCRNPSTEAGSKYNVESMEDDIPTGASCRFEMISGVTFQPCIVEVL